MDFNVWLIIFLYIIIGLILIIDGARFLKSFVSIIAFLTGFFLTIYILNINIYELFVTQKDIFNILISIWIPIFVGILFSFLAMLFVRFFISLSNASFFYFMFNLIGPILGLDKEFVSFIGALLAVFLFLIILFANKYYGLILIFKTSLWGGFLVSVGLIILFLYFFDINYLKLIPYFIFDKFIINIQGIYKMYFYLSWIFFLIVGIRIQTKKI